MQWLQWFLYLRRILLIPPPFILKPLPRAIGILNRVTIATTALMPFPSQFAAKIEDSGG